MEHDNTDDPTNPDLDNFAPIQQPLLQPAQFIQAAQNRSARNNFIEDHFNEAAVAAAAAQD